MRHAAILVCLSLLILGVGVEPAPGNPVQFQAIPPRRSVAVNDLPATRGSPAVMWDITDWVLVVLDGGWRRGLEARGSP
jgi:hypothetical protein